MFVFEIRYPGTWLQADDNDWVFRIENLLQLLEGQFTDAAVALNLFELERTRTAGRLEDLKRAREDEFEQRRALEAALQRKLGLSGYLQLREVVQEEIDRQIRHAKWQSGKLPKRYEDRIVFMYAHAYLYALDSFGRIHSRLCQEKAIPDGIQRLKEKFNTEFPQLKGVRDSAHHIEDRGLGMDRHGKPLKLKGIDSRFIQAPNGALVLRTLNGNRLGYTTENGDYTEIEISKDKLSIVQEIFQDTVELFEWTGPVRLSPDS